MCLTFLFSKCRWCCSCSQSYSQNMILFSIKISKVSDQTSQKVKMPILCSVHFVNVDEWCIADIIKVLKNRIKYKKKNLTDIWLHIISQLHANIFLFIIHYALCLYSRCICECCKGRAFIHVIILTCQSFTFTLWVLRKPLPTEHKIQVYCNMLCCESDMLWRFFHTVHHYPSQWRILKILHGVTKEI